ncbi:squamous cell carcinoma antigen recognized by T-cells 3 [Erpetoichthys calabaricus]|uniref:squamous cell carcinoma antigen recognized by T-cells 3 n=1 Tax=Erpetoichthys calabaricus TaxID=27687 RepID=UPI002234D6AC|nr:squamous cell carcinoma antigen recognized by T-cells 3 [Erpetoichthys calabaricus]
MAASGNDEDPQVQEMEEEEEEETAGQEREMESEDEGEMGVEGTNEDDDEEDSSDDDKENEAEIQRLEEQLSINAYDYNCHVDLIKLLRQEGELVRLRRARQKMSELFPLTEEIWLDWLRDEMRVAEDEDDREKVCELFEKAIKDYICPEVWLEYSQYSIGGIGKPGGIDSARAIFESALTAVGLHITKGASIWEAYREFENVILQATQPPPGSIPTQEQQKALNSQMERIHTIFRRQLAIPSFAMETTYTEYEEWSEKPVPDTVVLNYKKALQQMEKSKPFEEALLVADSPKLAEYQSYIDYEMKEGDPARIQIIFERALSENCLVPDLWAKYTQYLDRQLKIKDMVLSAHERAVRNCPWTIGLWKNYLLALERHGSEHKTVSDTFDKAINAGFIQATDYVDIWQAYLDYLRRRVDFSKESSKELEELRSTYARALEYIKQDVEERFSESGDPSCTIMQNWARIEASHCKNIQKARELWDSIMTKGNAKYANMWLEYYNLERSHGDVQHCRKALHRAVQFTSDYPEHVCEVLLAFERVEGTLEDWDTAIQKMEVKLNRVNEQRAKVAEKEAQFAKQEEEKAEQRRKAKADKKAQKKAQKSGRAGEKHKAEEEEEEEDEWGVETDVHSGVTFQEQPRKKHKGEKDPSAMEGAEDAAMETEVGLHGRKSETPAAQKSRAVAAAAKQVQQVVHDSRKDNVTVFVSNLSFSLENLEEKLKEIFEGCGPVEQIRPIYKRGMFRGYCYVQFENQNSAAEALKLDRKEIEGRPMFVSPSVDKSKNPDFKVFKYSTSMEKHKIFISGLPFSCTKEQLEEMCKEHGIIKDIRLVTNRSGKPKGLAYVEFENDSQASGAVLKMDGMVFQDHTLKVAISNPPRRNLPEQPDTSKPQGSLIPRQVYGARGKGRTQLSLLPWSLHRQSVLETKAENGTVQGQLEKSGLEPLEAPALKPMSNADFSRMLLKK